MTSRRQPRHFVGNDLTLGLSEDGTELVLDARARSGHLYIPGKTGSGKSRFLTSLIRQDIANWRRTNCGLLLLDPHGEIVDSLVAWLSRTPRFKRLPIVLIDLGRDDRLVGYSPLRRRDGVSPAVSAAQMTEGLLHAFGQLDPTDTPTITRVLTTVLQTLIVAGLPLTAVFSLLDSEQSHERARLLATLEDASAKADFERLARLSKARFEEEVVGPINRLSAFLKNPLLRVILGQSEAGFNFDWAINEGAIVLVSLAARGRKVTASDGKLFASLLLSDLWQAAMARGKAVEGGVKPFYVYIDEAASLCTPTIAQNLDQARGFGLHLTLANQMLSQFESYGGAYGRAIRKSVIANTLNKVCFRQSTDEDDLIPLVRSLFLGRFDPLREKRILTSFQTVGHTEEERRVESGSTTRARSVGESVTDTDSESSTDTDTWSTSSGMTESDSSSESETSVDDDDGTSSTTGRGASAGWSTSDSSGGSSTSGRSSSTAYSKSKQRTASATRGYSQQFVLRPVVEERISSVQYYALPEQLLLFEQELTQLAKREALAHCDGWKMPVKFHTPDVVDPYVRPHWIERFREEAMAQHAFWLTFADAAARLEVTRGAEPPPQTLKSYGRRSGTASGNSSDSGEDNR